MKGGMECRDDESDESRQLKKRKETLNQMNPEQLKERAWWVGPRNGTISKKEDSEADEKESVEDLINLIVEREETNKIHLNKPSLNLVDCVKTGASKASRLELQKAFELKPLAGDAPLPTPGPQAPPLHHCSPPLLRETDEEEFARLMAAGAAAGSTTAADTGK